MFSGILLVDKPSGPTSHDIVAMARKKLGLKKVGHAGTLDPMASGLLTLGVGQGTKLLTFLVGADKTYTATIRLGETTDSDDAEGEIVGRAPSEDLDALTEDSIASALSGFRGRISQVPSRVSAIKIEGKRAYQRVRDGEEVTIPAREVTIHRLEWSTPRRAGVCWEVDIEVECSSGTYIRAIARDLGEALGVGGHLTMLRRVAVGSFSVEKACAPDQIDPTRLWDLATVATRVMDHRIVSHAEAVELGHGKKIFLDDVSDHDAPLACIDGDGRLVAIVRVEKGVSRILVGFPNVEG